MVQEFFEGECEGNRVDRYIPVVECSDRVC